MVDVHHSGASLSSAALLAVVSLAVPGCNGSSPGSTGGPDYGNGPMTSGEGGPSSTDTDGGPPSIGVIGTFGDQTFTAESLLAATLSGSGSGSASVSGSTTTIVFSTIPSACAFYGGTNPVFPSSLQTFSIQIEASAALAPGTFAVTTAGPSAVAASYEASMNGCTTDSEEATKGSVTIMAVSSSLITGTFDLTLGEAGSTNTGGGSVVSSREVSGSFSAPVCAAFATWLAQSDGGGAPSNTDAACP